MSSTNKKRGNSRKPVLLEYLYVSVILAVPTFGRVVACVSAFQPSYVNVSVRQLTSPTVQILRSTSETQTSPFSLNSDRNQDLIPRGSDSGDEIRVPHDASTRRFETWLRAIPGAWVDHRVRHAYFDELRGLAWTETEESTSIKGVSHHVATIPASLVLSARYKSDDWDTSLAVPLWKEVLGEMNQADSSKYSGYIRLLTGDFANLNPTDPAYVPISTAPHALRHWSTSQKDALASTKAGATLVALEQRQNELWQQKYNNLEPADKETMKWEQFQWAMEVVHSRAFRGVQTPLKQLPPITMLPISIPAIAALIGYVYTTETMYPSEGVLALLAIATAVVSAGFAMVTSTGSSSQTAVLLPLIDSANHLQTAESTIVYDPLQDAFCLSIGPNCLVDAADNTANHTNFDSSIISRQLYINYGQKSDSECLLNYGFLPNVSVRLRSRHAEKLSGGLSSPLEIDVYRQRLVQVFHMRNMQQSCPM